MEDFKPQINTRAMHNCITQFLTPETNQITTTKNTEYSARATAEPDVTQEVQLGGYLDVSEVTHQAANSEMIQDPFKSFNMESFNVDDSLNREYPIGTITWDSSQARDTALASFNFPDVLFNQSYIQNRIKDYQYFRGAIRITVRVVTNQFLYGACILCFAPYLMENGVPTNDLKEMSGYPHMLISASSAEAASFDIPFICKDRVLDIVNYVTGQMAQVNIAVAVPLIDAVNASVVSTKLFVTAQFVDAEVFLPVTLTSSNSKGKEANKKSSAGIISGTLNTMTDVASIVECVPFVSPYASMFNAIAKPATSMFRRMGLSKPTTTAMTQVGKINPYVDINQGEGLDLAPKLGFCPTNGISTIPNVGGQSIDEMELLYVAGTPQLSDYIAPGYSSIGTTFELFDVSSLASPDYMDTVNSLFAYSAGSMKVAIYIFASKYHSVRLVFWINQGTSTGTHWENCYHKVLDVQGDTNIFFTVPYMQKEFASNNVADSTPRVYMTVVSYNQPDNALDTPIFVLCYKAAASDYSWGGLTDTVAIQSNPRADFSKEFESFHTSVTGYKESGLLYGEKYRSFREVIHRYSPDCAPYTSSTHPLSAYQVGGYNNLAGTSKVFTGLEKIGLFYLFHRGAVRVKIVQYGTYASVPRCLIAGTSTVLYSGLAISSATNPVVELEIPWYSNKAFGSNYTYHPEEAIPMAISKGSPSGVDDTTFLMKSAGDDFSFHFLVPYKGKILPSFNTEVPRFGTNGLYNALTQ
jgi:hypothetical protein